MPTYAYACADCGHAFDIVQTFADDSLTVCPQCQGRLRKQFNAVGVVFKGSGFYRTDSRSGNSGTSASSGGSSSTSATSSDATSGSDKAAAATDTTAASPAKGSGATTPSSTGSTGKSAASTA